MVDMKLVQGEMDRLEIKEYKSFSPSIRNLEKLFRKYEVSEYAEFYYDGEEYGKNQSHIMSWIDTLSEGQWGMSQTDVDRAAWSALRMIRNYSRAERWYLCNHNGECSLFFYGRDISANSFRDYWITFCQRRKGLHMKWHRRNEEAEE